MKTSHKLLITGKALLLSAIALGSGVFSVHAAIPDMAPIGQVFSDESPAYSSWVVSPQDTRLVSLYTNYGWDSRYQAGAFGAPNKIGAGAGMAVQFAQADVDNDGDTDMLLARYGGDATLLLQENEQYSAAAGFPQMNLLAVDTIFLDINEDGRIDIFIADRGGNHKLMRNDGEGVFTQVDSPLLQIADTVVDVFSGDLNADGHTDVVALHDEAENEVFLGSGNGQFNHAPGSDFTADVLGTTHAEFADFNADGQLDVLIVGMQEIARLYTGNGDGTFADVAFVTGQDLLFASGAVAADFDNDTDIDLYIPSAVGKVSEVLMNTGDGTFVREENHSLAVAATLSGAHAHDYDADGDVDLTTYGTEGGVLQNQLGQSNWAQIMLQSGLQNRFGIGATVYVTIAGNTQVYSVTSDQPAVHVGLGNANQIDALRVVWVGGAETMLENLDGNQVHIIDDGAVLPAGGENLVQDGDMELAGVEYWADYSGNHVKEKRDDAGNQYLYAERTNGGFGVSQRPIDVVPGETYRLRMRYQFEHGERVRPVLNVQGVGGNNADLEGVYENLVRTPNGQWAWYERVFIVPEEATGYLTLFITARSGTDATGSFLLDDVSIEEYNSASLIADGNMEDATTASWINYGDVDLKEKRTEGTNQYLYIEDSNSGYGVQQENIELIADKTYTLRFRYQFEEGERVRPILNIDGIGGNNADFEGIYQNIPKTSGGNWSWYERVFTTPEDLGTVVLDLRITARPGNANPSWFMIDDVMLEETDDTIIQDGDMEAATTASWINYGPAAEILSKEKVPEAYGGSQALSVVIDPSYAHGLGVQQSAIPLEAGQSYKLSFWYKANTSVQSRIGNQTANEDFEKIVTLYPQESWEYYERIFAIENIQNDEDIQLVFVVKPSYHQLLNGETYTTLEYIYETGETIQDGVVLAPGALEPDDFEEVQVEGPQLWIDDVSITAIQ